ncbi:hypothetical protein L6164_003325 [Bauhinia variegata]|uniref:Uncharacterized protein n=1 Tax=Bauhinia variegata TaxID=167791 RepID=A0ACB9Q1K7_BAUVA|nr:hypothetical protein L6164_003325 [Bauhinia variegata]
MSNSVSILCSIPSYSPNCRESRTLALTHSHFLSSNSFLKLKYQPFLRNTRLTVSRRQRPPSSFVVLAVQSNFIKVLQTAWKVSRDGIEAGTNLVPNFIPKQIARVGVTIAALSVSLFVLKAFLSTAFFAVATMGLVYFAFLAFNKDGGPSGDGGGTTSPPPMDDPVEEARKIMEKYK